MKDSKLANSLSRWRVTGAQFGAALLAWIDRFVPAPQRNADADTIRRSRLLVGLSFGLGIVALLALVFNYHMKGQMFPATWALAVLSSLLLLTPFLFLWTESHLLAGILFPFVTLGAFAFMAYNNGGFEATALLWTPIIPLLATLLVGPRFGFISALFAAGEVFLFYSLSHHGYPFPRSLSPEQLTLNKAILLPALIITTSLIAWLYEHLRQKAIALAEQSRIALHYSETYFRSLIENTSDYIAMLDRDGVFQYLNPAHLPGLGYRPDELLGQNAFAFLHPEDQPNVIQAFHNKVTIPGVGSRIEFRFRHGDGSWRTLEACADNLLHDPAVRGIIITSHDITERKQIERLKDELVSTVSHELRTPLTSLRGFTELMLKKEFSREKQKEFLSVIQQESIRLTNLINDFLDLQRMESGHQQIPLTPLQIDALLRESLTIHTPNNGLHVGQADLPDWLPPVLADTDQLRQVLANLFSNAVKYSPHGGRITVGARRRDEEIVVWVADEGMGIPREALGQLFTKFYRVNNADTRSIGGTGLGLALVKKIVETHGGRVWVESTLGQGSIFFFSLPVAVEGGQDARL